MSLRSIYPIMLLYYFLFSAFSSFIIAKPVSQSLYDLHIGGMFVEKSIDTAYPDESNESGIDKCSADDFDNSQDGGIIRRGTTVCPAEPSPPITLEKIPTREDQLTRSKGLCPDKARPLHLYCKGPEVLDESRPSFPKMIEVVLYCQLGKSSF